MRGVGRSVVTGWALLVAGGGWAATLLLGEPSATAGPGPAPSSGSPDGNPVPGPQPDSSCTTAPAPSESGDPLSAAKVPDAYADGYVRQVYCTTVVVRDRAVAR